jgi:hypothetical protein
LLHEGKECPTVVVKRQDELVAQSHPNLILWWDRWSLSDYLTADGEHVTSGTARFWQLRRATLASDVRRLTAAGARVVFVATEPPSVGILSRCEPEGCQRWAQFLIDRYRGITTRWNAMMQDYATRHPDRATFVSVTATMCHADVSPCDDTIDGVPARPDGTHYEGPAEKIVVDALDDMLAPLLAHR